MKKLLLLLLVLPVISFGKEWQKIEGTDCYKSHKRGQLPIIKCDSDSDGGGGYDPNNSKPKKIKKKQKPKNDVLNYVFSKKWQVLGLPCNFNGGSYQVFSSKFKEGNKMAIQGKLQKSPSQGVVSLFQVIDGKTFRHSFAAYAEGNPLFEPFFGPNARTAYVVDEYSLIDKKTLRKTRIEHSQINWDMAAKGIYQEDRGSEWGKVSTIKACK